MFATFNLDSSRNIRLLILSNFLSGLVFWYGIEKLFTTHIGLSKYTVGLAAAIASATILLLDVPSGMLADKWSRKGTLLISTLCMAVATLLIVVGANGPWYILGYFFYGCYVVCTSGTYSALVYDTLHEEGRAEIYSRVQGRVYGWFLVGAGVANVASGLLARHNLELPFYVTLLPVAAGALVLARVAEPSYHKDLSRSFMGHFRAGLHAVGQNKALVTLLAIQTIVSMNYAFKLDFGQFFYLQFFHGPIGLGLFWAVYAFCLAGGSFIAHRIRRFNLYALIAVSQVLVVGTGFIHHPIALILFLAEATVLQACFNLSDTYMQGHFSSQVRSSLSSLTSTLRTLTFLPFILVFSKVTDRKGIATSFEALGYIAIFAILLSGAYYLSTTRREHSQ